MMIDYNTLCSPESRLNDNMSMIGMNMILHQAKYPADTVMMSSAAFLLTQPFTANKLKQLRNYILPRDVPSENISTIIFLNNHNLQMTHWNVICLDLKKMNAVCYCSLSWSFPKNDLARFLTYFTSAYPAYQYILTKKIKEIRGECPQQTDGFSCGFFALLSAKVIVSKQRLHTKSYAFRDVENIRSLLLACYNRLLTKAIPEKVQKDLT